MERNDYPRTASTGAPEDPEPDFTSPDAAQLYRAMEMTLRLLRAEFELASATESLPSGQTG